MEKTEEIQLEGLGYNAFFEEGRVALAVEPTQTGRVTSEHKGLYKVKTTQGEYIAKVTGKCIFEAEGREDFPAVGDWVALTELGNEQAVISAIFPRHTILKRVSGDKNKSGRKNKTQIIDTNIDYAFIVESVDRDYSPNRFERYIAIAQKGGVQPVLVLNKVDLITEEELSEKVAELKTRFPNVAVVPTSIVSGEGLVGMRTHILDGKTYRFLGSSGVGKSSLINTLLGEDAIATGDISVHAHRGKHTTTSRQMYFLTTGGIVIDNPGIREVEISDNSQEVDVIFDEITARAHECKYRDCTNTHETGCVIREAVKAKELDEDQYHNYLNLKKEAEYHEMDEYEKRKKDKSFGKFLKKAKKDFRNRKY